MRKKGFETDLSISVLLTVPDKTNHQMIAETYLSASFPDFQKIYLNKEEENLPISLVRDLINQASFSRASQEKLAYVLCGAEKASLPAQNALLKILEEPPQNILLVLVASQGHQLLPTIISRCQEISLLAPQSISETSVAAHLQQTLDFCLQPTILRFYQLIDLAENWKKDELREKNWSELINLLLANPIKNSFILEKLRETLDSLKKNGNVKVVIEHCLFAIKKHYLN
ncbi:MAG: hypothetical protein ACOZAK_00755 [Patescibacteria group bacterium]